MAMFENTKSDRLRLHLYLLKVIGVIVPQRLRSDWRQEWEAELRHREPLLAQWDRLDWRHKLDLLRRSAGAFWDALWLQPQRLEDEMFQDLRYGAVKLIIGQGLKLILIGVALGLAGAVVLTRLLADWLFGVSPTDPTTFVIISLLLVGVALLASYLPAQRAMKVDPAVALRHE
jgi:hypothetical protein